MGELYISARSIERRNYPTSFSKPSIDGQPIPVPVFAVAFAFLGTMHNLREERTWRVRPGTGEGEGGKGITT